MDSNNESAARTRPLSRSAPATSRPYRWLWAVLALGLAAAGCSDGPTAPAIDGSEEVCIDDFCAAYPAGWEVVEAGNRFVSFSHPRAEDVIATVGRVNLEGIASSAGGGWPLPAREVVDLFWQILDGGEAELSAVMLEAGGVYDSQGFISTGRLWHRLIPVTASRGFGIEVRAPNNSWREHADLFRNGLRILNEDL